MFGDVELVVGHRISLGDVGSYLLRLRGCRVSLHGEADGFLGARDYQFVFICCLELDGSDT